MTAISAMTISLLFGCAENPAPLQLARNVDLERYAGRWYVIANIPYFAESGKVGSYFDLNFTADGKLTDIYNGRERSFDAPIGQFTMTGYVVPGTGNAMWRESPFWPLYFSYPILYVDPDYRHALVGYPGRSYGWILSRAPEMEDSVYNSLLLKLSDAGYDVTKFKRVPQSPDQLGRPGFQ